MHECKSYMQKENASQGVCEFASLCTPMKKALVNEELVVEQLGKIICPYHHINLAQVKNNNFPGK